MLKCNFDVGDGDVNHFSTVRKLDLQFCHNILLTIVDKPQKNRLGQYPMKARSENLDVLISDYVINQIDGKKMLRAVDTFKDALHSYVGIS